MGLVLWIIVGLAAGAIAKMITPQKEKEGWISSLVIGLAGSMLGGFVFGLLGVNFDSMIGSLICAVLGSLLVLFLYHKFYKGRA